MNHKEAKIIFRAGFALSAIMQEAREFGNADLEKALDPIVNSLAGLILYSEYKDFPFLAGDYYNKRGEDDDV